MPTNLIVVLGLPGSGKSSLAGRLARKLGIASLSSDVLRGEMGLKGDYRMETIETVYQEMLSLARSVLQRGDSVVLDGSFSNRRFRDDAQTVAHETGARLILIHMVANEETTLRRVGRKREVSEAGPEAYSLLKRHFQPVEGEHLRLDSSNTAVDRLVAQAADYVAATAVR